MKIIFAYEYKGRTLVNMENKDTCRKEGNNLRYKKGSHSQVCDQIFLVNRSHFLANSAPFLCRVRSDPTHGRSVANNGGTSVPRGGVKETEAQETIQREPYLTGDSFLQG